MKTKKTLSPIQKIVFDKYGALGLRIYDSCDGKSGPQIMKETGASESKLVEILDFLNEQGIIKLEQSGISGSS
ncbi:hypothetical protein H0O00_05670 [Candidatus Micrarchaeota archaeon]|nr:hypothetical protein [Candidatus Micrarchaeota archaeon]